jgi:hypothetical protein
LSFLRGLSGGSGSGSEKGQKGYAQSYGFYEIFSDSIHDLTFSNRLLDIIASIDSSRSSFPFSSSYLFVA